MTWYEEIVDKKGEMIAVHLNTVKIFEFHSHRFRLDCFVCFRNDGRLRIQSIQGSLKMTSYFSFYPLE